MGAGRGGALYPGAKGLMAAFPISFFSMISFIYMWDSWAQAKVKSLKVRSPAQIRTFGEYQEPAEEEHAAH